MYVVSNAGRREEDLLLLRRREEEMRSEGGDVSLHIMEVRGLLHKRC